ncbi:MAG: DNA adenine methylase [Proteobacteria bacterium]|nr:DNA adenine methylase [Pseudomonadota bacterium]
MPTLAPCRDSRSESQGVPAPSRLEREAAPFVKWAGGKGRILAQLLPLLPPGVRFMRHVEPFAGGAALFFARRPRRALLADVNPSLIATYSSVRDEVENVISALEPLAQAHCADHYYEMRQRYNQQQNLPPARRAALFIYLNKTCFNGLYRVNRRGNFNVPAGRYRNPRILNAPLLRTASASLANVELRCVGFESMLSLTRPGDFVYLDPPYAPASATANFTSYARDGFTSGMQVRLRDVFKELNRRGCRLMLSNSDVSQVRELYADFHVDTVAAPRAINRDAHRRGLVSEVVIRNYTVKGESRPAAVLDGRRDYLASAS